MHFLSCIGMDSLVKNENNFNILKSYLQYNGKIFHGYSGLYLYGSLGYVEFILHLEYNKIKNTSEAIGFSSHMISNNIWTLIISSENNFNQQNDDDRLSKWLRFYKEGIEEQNVSIRLIHSDVLPCFSAGETVTMQVAAFPLEINYYADESEWLRKKSSKFMGNYVNIKDGNILSFGLDDTSFIKAKVKGVETLKSINEKKERISFYAITIETCYGDIAIYHDINMVSEKERKFIKAGASVITTCVIQGDVAIEKYQQGAIWDENHCLKLLKDCFNNYDFSRVNNAFAEDAQYISINNEIKYMNKKDIIKRLQDNSNARQNSDRLLYAYIGKAISYRGIGKDIHNIAGKNIIVLSSDTPAQFFQIVALKMNEENIIAKIILPRVEDYEISISSNNSIEPGEFVYLNLLKESFDSANCANLIDILNYDVQYTDYEKVIDCTCYEVLARLEKMITPTVKSARIMLDPTQEINGSTLEWNSVSYAPSFKPQTFLVEVSEDFSTNHCSINAGQKGLALSLNGLESYETIIFIKIRNSKIDVIEVLENNNLKLNELESIKEICKYEHDRNFKRVITERSVIEWLEFIKSWIEGNNVDEIAFYAGLEPSCIMTIYTDKYTNRLEDKETIFINLKTLVNLPDIEYCEIQEKEAGSAELITNIFRLTIENSERDKIKKITVMILQAFSSGYSGVKNFECIFNE